MTQDEMIEIARKAGSLIEIAQEKDLLWLASFAKLIAQHEREACAQMLEAASKTGKIISCTSAAKAIRARGEA
jgi:hypothetical protein